MSVPVVKLNDGNLMPIVGLGTGGLTKEAIQHGLGSTGLTKEVIEHAINCGYRHFDCAYMYKTEKFVGEAVNEAINDGRVKREDIFFVFKVWSTYYSKGRVIKSAKHSIEESGLKYLDLLLLHWPIVLMDFDAVGFPKLPDGDIAYSDYDLMDVYKELEEVKRMGLAKSIGVSNFNSEQIERVLKIAEFIPVTNQVECHPYLSQEKLIKFCGHRNIIITAYSPLGSSGELRKKDMPLLFDDQTLQSIANKYNKSVAQILIRWQTQRGVVVIPRSSNKECIQQNINIFDFTITDEDMALINALKRNLRYIDIKNLGLGGHKEYPFDIEY